MLARLYTHRARIVRTSRRRLATRYRTQSTELIFGHTRENKICISQLASVLVFDQDALGDVHEHRACVRVVGTATQRTRGGGLSPVGGPRPPKKCVNPAEANKKTKDGCVNPAEANKKTKDGCVDPAEANRKPPQKNCVNPAEANRKPTKQTA